MKKLIWLIIIIAIVGLIWWAIKDGRERLITDDSPSTPSLPADGAGVDTAGWQTYRNEEYGVEISYPLDYSYEYDDNVSGRAVVSFLETGLDFQVPISLVFEKATLSEQDKIITIDDWVKSWYCNGNCVDKLYGETSNPAEVFKYKAAPEIGERIGYAFNGHEIYLMLDTIDQGQKVLILDQMADSLTYPVSVRVR